MSQNESSRPWREAQWRTLGNWEPKMFLQRRGDGAFTDLDALWKEIHSEAAIARMKRLGVNLSHIHCHKGYGLEHEAASIAEAKAWAERLHAAGIRVGAYLGCSFFFEAFRHPQYERMVLQNGVSGWNSAQYFRKFWCYNSPHAREYQREVVRVAVQDVHADVLHFDNAFGFTQDALCHCDYCIEGFHRFVRDEIPEIAAAAGYDDPELLLPPPKGGLEYLSQIKSVLEPGRIAWLLYHSEAGFRALKDMAEYGRSLSPDIAILYNGANLCGITPFSRPHREMDAYSLVDITAVEDTLENPPGVAADGMPISRFRPYKTGSRTQTRVYCYTVEEGRDNALMLAESAVFNYRTLGVVECAMQLNHRLESPADLAVLDYLVRNEDLFLDREPWHQAAVLRHYESMLLNPWPSALSPYVVEQALFENHLPFALVGNGDLSAGDLLKEFDLLILPDTRCLKDAEVKELLGYVEAGGKLLVIGDSGTATALNQYRARWAFEPLFGGGDALAAPRSAVRYDETPVEAAAGGNSRSANVLRARFGRGEARYLPALGFVLPDAPPSSRFGGFDWYYHPYWRAPKNVGQLLGAVRELLGDRLRAETDLPRHAGVEFYRVSGGYRIHCLNYAHPAVVPESRLTLRFAGQLARPPASLLWRTPEEERKIAPQAAGRGEVTVALPAFKLLATLDVIAAPSFNPIEERT